MIEQAALAEAASCAASSSARARADAAAASIFDILSNWTWSRESFTMLGLMATPAMDSSFDFPFRAPLAGPDRTSTGETALVPRVLSRVDFSALVAPSDRR